MRFSDSGWVDFFILLLKNPDKHVNLNACLGEIVSVLRYINFFILCSIQVKFIFLVFFFIKQRLLNLRAKMKTESVKNSSFVKFMMCWSLILYGLTIYKSLTGFIEINGHYINNDSFYHSNYYKNYAQFLVYVIFPLKECLIMLSLTYLYYFQGTKEEKRK